MNLDLADRVALVGGSSRGIGHAIANAFVDEGAYVCITGRDLRTLNSARETLTNPSRVLPVEGDLTDKAHVQETLDRCVSRWGGIDIVVANVGTGAGPTSWLCPESEWNRLFRVNFEASVVLAQCAVPYLLKRGRGCVLFISSITGLEATPAPLPYSAAKAAVINYAKNLSRQLAPSNIRVNTIAPGNILFPASRWEERLQTQGDAVLDYIRTEVPMARFGTPNEVAALAAFVCSDRASFITGACIACDGGQSRSI